MSPPRKNSMGPDATPSPTPSIDGASRALQFTSEHIDICRLTRYPNLPQPGIPGCGTPPPDEDQACAGDLLGQHIKEDLSKQFGNLFPADFTTNHQVSEFPHLVRRGSSNQGGEVSGPRFVQSTLQLVKPRSAPNKKRSTGKPGKKGKKLQFPDLVQPLSVWAGENGFRPKDVHAFATRDVQNRKFQARKNNGHVKRNLNVFFLYKRAYSDVAREWLKYHHPSIANTQPPLVSLIGESWSKESADFKQSYIKYSELEKDGLRKAFPNYKYQPGTKKGQSKDAAEFNEATNQHTMYRVGGQQQPGQQVVPSQLGYYGSEQSGAQSYTGIVKDRPWRNDYAAVGIEPQVAPITTPYGGGWHRSISYSGSPEPTPAAESYLHPSHGSWRNGIRRVVARSASPGLVHYPQECFPIDPSLSASDTYDTFDAYSEGYCPSRAVSEEPSCIDPSRTFNPLHIDPSRLRAISMGPLRPNTDSVAEDATWHSYPLPRAMSEDLWPPANDADLSSVPQGNDVYHDFLGTGSGGWNLESSSSQDEHIYIPHDLLQWGDGEDGVDDLANLVNLD